MTRVTTDDDVKLHVEEYGKGDVVLFLHEFAGDHRSWHPQVRYFARRYRVVIYAARGFPPSDVPTDPERYGQYRAVDDAVAVLDAVGAERAHVVGNSMGGFTALHLARLHPGRVRSAVASGCGYGAHPDVREKFRAESEMIATAFDTEGSEAMSHWYGAGPARVQYQAKDPFGHAEHIRVLAEHDDAGAALTMRRVQKERPSLYELADEFAAMSVPVLIIAGDEDDGALETNLMLKRTIPRAGLAVLPKSGHVTNLEEPELFNRLVERFFAEVEHDRWPARDPRSQTSSTTGAR